MANTWLNEDGLLLKYGPTRVAPGAGGEYRNDGAEREIEFTIDLADLPVTTTAGGGAVPDKIPLSTVVIIPEGAVPMSTTITNLTLVEETGGANLDVGFLKASDLTAYDVDDLVDAGDGFIGVAGLRQHFSENDTTEAGDGYGVALTEPCIMCAGLDATDDTATGTIKITFKYLIPTTAGDIYDI